jgi:2',3'-cyclic-nucleotide 2'-phosphodiesterase (5'-nucleotidase family)
MITVLIAVVLTACCAGTAFAAKGKGGKGSKGTTKAAPRTTYRTYNTYTQRNYQAGTQGTAGTATAKKSAEPAKTTVIKLDNTGSKGKTGDALHQTNLADKSLDSLADTYYRNSDKKTIDRDKDSIAVFFTGGVLNGLDNLAKVRSFYGDTLNEFPVSYLFDTGNDSMTVPYNAIYSSRAPVQRMMGKAAYDAAGLGISEISQGEKGLSGMLKSAVKSGEIVPYLCCANLSGSDKLKKAYKKFGVKDYTVIRKYGKKVVVFGLIGEEPFNSYAPRGLKFQDPVKAAGNVMKQIKKNKVKPDLVVCLTNFGDSADKSRSADVSLAKSVKGIDLIISGNSAVTLKKPVQSGKTRIVSAASGARWAGYVRFKKKDGDYKYKSLRMVDLNKRKGKSDVVTSAMPKYRALYDSAYFKKYGCTYNSETAENPYTMSVRAAAQSAGDNAYGNLVADSYLRAAKKSAGLNDNILLSAVSTKAIRGDLKKGTVRTKDVFSLFSQNLSDDNRVGVPLVSCWLKGSELKKLTELVASGFKSKKENGRVYFGGMVFSYNPHRFPGNRVFRLKVKTKNGKTVKVNKDRLYRIVTDRDTAAAIRTMIAEKGNSKGIVPRDRGGRKLTRIPALMRKNSEREVKAWTALANCLKSYESGAVPEVYAKADGRMLYDNSRNPVHLLSGSAKTFGILLACFVLVIAVIILLIILLSNVFGRRRRRNRRIKYPKRAKQKPIFTKK